MSQRGDLTPTSARGRLARPQTGHSCKRFQNRLPLTEEIMKPTLHHVAEEAGVSIASASRALTGNSASLETVRRVREAAKRLGYVPNATARSLRLGGTRHVVFAVDDIGNPNYVAMLRAIEEKFKEARIRLNVMSTGRNPGEAVNLIATLNRGAGDGLIISPIRVTPELRRAIANAVVPVVVIGTLHREVAIDQVQIDSAAAIELAVDHLVKSGRRRLLLLNGPLDTNPGAARRRGFLAAVGRIGLNLDESDVHFAEDFTVAAGAAVIERLAAGGRLADYDAIVGANDLLAIGALAAAHRYGLSIGDLAITGMDDTELAEVYLPSITSVSLRAATRGELAADLLLRRFGDPGRAAESLRVSPTLVVRESTAGVL